MAWFACLKDPLVAMLNEGKRSGKDFIILTQAKGDGVLSEDGGGRSSEKWPVSGHI